MSTSRRTRAVSGALTLMAMVLSLAEAGAASACGPMPANGVDVAATGGHAEARPPHEPTSAHEPCPSCARAAGASDGPAQSDCPWSGAMEAGCAAPASLRSSPPAMAVAALEQVLAPPAVADLPASHPSGPLFHPPRA